MILVTGAHGFIGRHVVDNLVSRGERVLAFDRQRHHEPQPGVTDFLGDIRDATDVTEAMAHATGFIHLAAVLGTQETIANPIPAAETNIIGGLNILEAGAQYGLPGVYICVGNHWMNNTYSITKTAVERFVRMFNTDRGTRVNLVRVVNAYGPRQVAAAPYGPGKVRKIIPAFVCRALSGTPIEVYGDGEQVSDMVWVQDVAEALVRALQKAASGFSDLCIEVGPERHTTVNDVAQLVSEAAECVTGRRMPIEHVPMRPGEQIGRSVTADVDTLQLIGLDAASLLPLPEGIRRTVDWFWEHMGSAWTPV